MDENLMKTLSEIVGAENCAAGEDIGADFMHDELPGGRPFPPELVVSVNDSEQAAAVLAACHAANVPVTVRGAGTGKAGGSVPVQGGVVLSVKGMDQILAVDEEAKTMTVQPGVLLQAVKAEAEAHGLCYPPDPGELTATIGGNASTNASGPCAAKYGRTRDYILDAGLVLSDGTRARLSDSPAYAAVPGSEGTLAVITELTLRLIDKPGADAILLLPFSDAETAVQAARTIEDAGFAPATLEYMDTDLVEFSGNVTGNPVFPVEMDGERVGGTLMLTLEGSDDDAVMEQMEQLAEMAEDLACLDILVGDTPTMKREFWAAHAAFHTSLESGAQSAWEVNADIPAQALPELIRFAKEEGEKLGFQVLLHAHVGSGGLHIYAASARSSSESAPAAEAFCSAVYAKCAALGGDVRGEYGFGYAKASLIPEDVRAAHAAAKAALDPAGILNPGKLI